MPSKSKSKLAQQEAQARLIKDIVIGAMLAIVVGLMPLIVRLALVNIPPELSHLYPAQHHPFGFADMFTYWKAWFIAAPAIIMAFYWLSDMLTRGKLPDVKALIKQPPVFLSLIYLLFVVLSALFSRYTTVSWRGAIDRSEGALMWFVYFIVMFSALVYMREQRNTRPVLFGLIFSSIIMGAIGMGQLFGYDFFNTGLALWLTIPGRLPEGVMVDSLNIVFDIAHATLFNPNTFGLYTAMITPLMLLCALTYKGSKIIKVLFLIAGLLMLVGVFASSSLGGFVGIIASVGVLIVTLTARFIFRPKNENEKDRKPMLIKAGIAAGILITVIAGMILFVPALNARVSHLLNRLTDAQTASTVDLRHLSVQDNDLMVHQQGHLLLRMNMVQDANDAIVVMVFDGSGAEVPIAERIEPPRERGADGTETATGVTIFHYDVPGFGRLSFSHFGNGMQIATFRGLLLVMVDGNLYGYDTRGLDLIDLSEPIPSWGFAGRERWGSNRGLIFSRTFPLMPARTILGSGPDTYVLIYPNHDLFGLYLAFGSPYATVDKAHNLFLNTWINTGGISAIALFALFGYYIFTTFFSLIKSKEEPLESFGLRLGLLASVSAFVMSSMATDSTIGSTGVFFVILGLGLGMNMIYKNNNTQAHEKNQ